MSSQQLILLAVGAIAVLAAAAAFVIVLRRTGDWKANLDSETLVADRSGPMMISTRETGESAAVEAVDPVEVPGITITTVEKLVEVSAEELGVTRRTFFNRAISAGFGVFLGGQALAWLAFFWPKVSGGFGADVNVGKAVTLLEQAINDDGTVTPVFVPDARAYIVPAPRALSAQFKDLPVTTEGVMALYQRCVHLGCRVPWCQSSQGFECPCHGSKYNGIGEYFGGPAPRNLDRFEVEINKAGDLVVKTGSIHQTPRAPELSVKYPQGPSCIAAAGAEGEA